MKDVRADRVGLLQGLVLGPQTVQERPQRIGEREHPSGLILRCARLQADFSGLPVYLAPHEREYLALYPPARHKGELDDGPNRRR